ncbi:MAG TPA: glycosyltransferase [bacterium]|nr:glycosyltransferase [bacterium]
MKVCVYLESGYSSNWSGGIRRAHDNQIKALKLAGVQVTTDPRESFDILHLHSVGPASLYLAERYSGRRPIVIHSHTTAEDFANSFRMSDHIAPYLGRYLRFFYGKADVLIAPSPYAREVLQRYEIDRPIEVVSNGVDLRRFAPHRRKRLIGRARYGLEGVVPFSVGLVFLRKGVDIFCDVARLMPEYTFAWFGRIHKAVKLDTLRIIEAAPENVIFTGYVEDVVEAYAAGDIFFFPSSVENEGIAVLEAAACGKPLVLRDAECFAGRFEHGVNCLKGNSAEEFAALIRQIAEDPVLAARLSTGALDLARAHALELVGQRLSAIYGRLV